MAETKNTNPQDALDETLERIATKSGVKATLVLDRATGSILKTSGQTSSLRTSKTTQPGASLSSPTTASFPTEQTPAAMTQEAESRGLEEFAAVVWSYVNASGALVEDLDTEDELKLLRLRTRKQELVIVPDPKYLLVVVHDTPPA